MEINILPLEVPLKFLRGLAISKQEMQNTLDLLREQNGLVVTGRFGVTHALEIGAALDDFVKPSHIVNNLRIKTDRGFGVRLSRAFPWVHVRGKARHTLVGNLIPLPNAEGNALYSYLAAGKRANVVLKGEGNLGSDGEIHGVVLSGVDLSVDGHCGRRFTVRGWKNDAR